MITVSPQLHSKESHKYADWLYGNKTMRIQSIYSVNNEQMEFNSLEVSFKGKTCKITLRNNESLKACPVLGLDSSIRVLVDSLLSNLDSVNTLSYSVLLNKNIDLIDIKRVSKDTKEFKVMHNKFIKVLNCFIDSSFNLIRNKKDNSKNIFTQIKFDNLTDNYNLYVQSYMNVYTFFLSKLKRKNIGDK
ncbi:MAG TPA: hypothetical protein PKO18_00055 [Chitinophagales bacterium]|nr:hypothetical protein [Chitinophagales bacterium]